MVGGWEGQVVAAMIIKEGEAISRSLPNVSFFFSSFKCDDVSA